MSVTITTPLKDWTPIEIIIKFKTRQQLAAFVEMYGVAGTIADAIKPITCYTKVGRAMTNQDMTTAINNTIDQNNWNTLARLADV